MEAGSRTLRVNVIARFVVALSGDLDIYSAPELRRVLDAIDGPAVIDLSDVHLLAAAGLTELALVAERIGCGQVRLVGAQANVRRVLTIVGFDRLFAIE